MHRRLVFLFAVAVTMAASGPSAAEISIGFANPLTGPYAASGGRNRSAVERAVEDLNDDGGVLGQDVRVITVDDACGIVLAVTAAQELVDAGVPVVVGHFCSGSSLMAAGVYEVANVLMITPSSTHPRLTEEGRRNVFRLIGRDDRQGELAGDFLAAHWTDRRIAILHDGSVYGEGLAAQTRQRLRQRGVTEAIYGAYRPGGVDYAVLVARLQRAGIDALYIGGYGPDAGLILRTARERGDDLQLIGGDGLGMDEFWLSAGAAGAGTIFSGRPDVRGLPEAAAVLAAFRARGLGPRPFGIGAYAAVEVWAQAVERTGSLELAAVARVLRRGWFDTVLGPVAFDDKGDLEGAGWQWQVWANGNYRPLNRGAATEPLFRADGLEQRTRWVRPWN
jgi:branched-chain amino acid transport system substrate-binding protein